MAQDQEKAVDQALSRLGKVAASIINVQKQSDILMKDSGLDDVMVQGGAALSPDASAALDLTLKVARNFERFSKQAWVESVNPDLEQITAYIQEQRATIREQQDTISALQQQAQAIDPAAIAQQCREEVMKSLTADNAPFGQGGLLDRISSATVGPHSSLGKTQAALESVHTATVGLQSSLAQAQGHLARMAAPDFISKPLQDLKASVDQQTIGISSIQNAIGSKTLSALSESLDDVLNAITTTDAGGNTTTVMHRMGDVVSAVFKRDTNGMVTNVGDLLTEVHSATVGEDRSLAAVHQATVGQDSTLSKVQTGLESSTFFSAMNKSLDEILRSVNATPSRDELPHKSPRAHEPGSLLSRVTRSASGIPRTPSASVAGPSSTTSSSLLPRPSSRPLLGPSASPSSAPASTPSTSGTVIALKQRTDEDATRLKDLLQNVPNVNTLVKKPLDVILQLDIRVGDGSSNIVAYPPLPSGLQIPTIMRLGTELSAKFGTMTDTKWTKDVMPGVNKSSCLYTKIFVKSGADGLYTACNNCQNNNRMCLRKAKTKENVLVTFIAPLPTPVDIDPLPTDGTEELRYWVPRLTESMTA
ncbi:hypothetical protein KCU67_g3559, partial [Aureobasidium melanogenum]